MKLEVKHLVYLTSLVLLAMLAYAGRAVLTPFILAAIFAYLLNPLVNFLAHRIKLPRTFSIILIYIILIGTAVTLVFNIGARLTEESNEFSQEARYFIQQANSQIFVLPGWLQPIARDIFDSVRTSLLFPRGRVVNYLPGAIDRTISSLVFLVATFYFLKDGRKFVDGFLSFFPPLARKELEIVGQKISQVLGAYLRGQLLLIAIMSSVTYAGLLIIGVRYSLILAIFTGFAEIIPFVGPAVATGLAMVVAFTDGFSHFGVNPLLDATAVLALYTVLRQLEDLFVIPQVMGRLTKLHPLIVLISSINCL